MADIFEKISNASDLVRSGKDGVYKLGKTMKEAADKQAQKVKSGSKISKEEQKKINEEEKRRQDAAARLSQTSSDPSSVEIRIDGELVDVGGPIEIDAARGEFEKVGEFNDVKMKTGVLVGNEIEDWLKGTFGRKQDDEIDEYEEYLAKKKGIVKEEEKVDVKKMRSRVQIAQMFKEEFNTSESFTQKTDMYNQISGLKVSDDNITRTANLSYVLDAFCGDLNAKALLNAIKNNAVEMRMANAIRECLDGNISQEIAVQRIFAEIHGIDSTQLENKEYPNEALVYLAAIQELSPQADIADLTGATAAELKSYRDAVLTGKNFTNRRFLAEMGVRNNVKEALKDGNIHVTDVKINGRVDGCIIYDPGLECETVDILRSKNGTQTLLGTADENGMITGSLDEVTKIVDAHDIADEVKSELDNRVKVYAKEMQREAANNQETPLEKARREQEEKEALEAHEKRRQGFMSTVN